jgi:hypothetical protein
MSLVRCVLGVLFLLGTLSRAVAQPESQPEETPAPGSLLEEPSERPLWVGLVAGETNGISLGYQLNPGTELEGRAEFGLFPVASGTLSLRGWLVAGVLKNERGPRLAVGLGARFGLVLDNQAPALGLMAPIGLQVPLGEVASLSFELSPGVLFADGAQIDLDASLGFRYFFARRATTPPISE